MKNKVGKKKICTTAGFSVFLKISESNQTQRAPQDERIYQHPSWQKSVWICVYSDADHFTDAHSVRICLNMLQHVRRRPESALAGAKDWKCPRAAFIRTLVPLFCLRGVNSVWLNVLLDKLTLTEGNIDFFNIWFFWHILTAKRAPIQPTTH